MADQPTAGDSEEAAAATGENLKKLGDQWQRLAEAQVALWRLSVTPNRCGNFRPGTALICSTYTDTVTPICIQNATILRRKSAVVRRGSPIISDLFRCEVTHVNRRATSPQSAGRHALSGR